MKPKSRRFTFTSLARVCLSTTFATFCASQSASAADGTWTNGSSSVWSTPGNWSGGIVADGSGFTANFNTLDIPADRVVSLDGDRTLTNLIFGDTEVLTTPAGWVLDNNGTSTNNLILAGVNPTITVNALGMGKSAVISAIIEGSVGMTKSGAGALILSGDNTFTGNVGNVLAGGITITHSNALGLGPKTVVMNSGNVATLRLNGSSGDLSVPAGISLQTAGLQTGGSIINVAGNNIINGPITLNSGGASGTAFSVDSGSLTLASTVRITGSVARILSLRGVGNGTVSGVILNGGASLPVSKDSGLGTWTLSGANTYTGDTTVSAGILKAGIASTATTGPFGVNSSVTVNAAGILEITGFDTRINALFGTGTVTLGSANLTIGTANSNSTFDGTLSGTGGSITKTGSGTQRQGGSTSTFTGGTTVQNGRLIVTNAAALGSGLLTLAGTTNQIDNFGIEGGITFAKSISIDLTTQRSGITALTAGNNTLSGPITISNSGPNNIVAISNNVNSSVFTVSGAISSTTATLTLSFRGSGTGSSGLVSNTLSLPSGSAVDLNGTTNWTFSGTGSTWGVTGIYGTGNIVLGANNALSITAVTGGGTSTGAIDLAGFNQTVGGLAGPVARVIGSSSTTADSILTIAAASPQTFSGVIADVFGPGTRKVFVELNGGSQTLAGTNTYTGTTTLNAGNLTVSGSLAGTAVEVKNTATLAGTGSLGGNVTVRSGGHQAFDIATTPGGQVTRSITGSLALNSGNIVDLTAAATPAAGSYNLVTAAGGITGTLPVVNFVGGTGTVSIVGNTLVLTVQSGGGYSTWAGVNAGGQTADLDFDNDGLRNGVEYFMGITTPGFTANPGLSGAVVTWPKSASFVGSYTVKTSSDLVTWTVPVSGIVDNGSSVTYTPPTGLGKIFVRLEVVPAP